LPVEAVRLYTVAIYEDEAAFRGQFTVRRKNMSFKEIDLKSLKINPFVMLGDEWALLSAGNEKKHNTMTIAWGSMGIMWNKPIFITVVRPQRYTKEFVDNNDLFSISFYPEKYKKALEILGTKSGKDCDKISESGLTPLFIDNTVAFEEATTVFICKKLHGGQQLNPADFVDKTLDQTNYPDKDYHYYYTGEIIKILQKD